jgi:hypothetical protein
MRERAATEDFCSDMACKCGSNGSMTTAATCMPTTAGATTCMPTTTAGATPSMPTAAAASTTSAAAASRIIGRAGAAGNCER